MDGWGERQSTNWEWNCVCVNHHRARQMFGAGSHSRSFMHPVTFNQSSLLDDFQIQPDLVTVVPGAAHPQLRMNFNQCEFFFFLFLSTIVEISYPLNRQLALPTTLRRVVLGLNP